MSVPPSLNATELEPVWALLSRRLEERGTAFRGRVRIQALHPRAEHVLRTLTGRRVGSLLDLAAIEQGLRERAGLSGELGEMLAMLGHAPSLELEERRQRRTAAQQARTAARDEVARWPEDWATLWIEDVVRAGLLRGLDQTESVGLMQGVRRLLDEVDRNVLDGVSVARNELAARLYGSAHALDSGTRLERVVKRALGHQSAAGSTAEVWAAAGVHLDRTSGAALVWNLAVDDTGLGRLCHAARGLRVPVHLSAYGLERYELTVQQRPTVVVENPRVVEAAAEVGSSLSLVAASGNPSRAVSMLIDRLGAGDAPVYYHGDFDGPGLAMCARMAARGVRPLLMTAESYLAALDAVAGTVALPDDRWGAASTPWDPPLEEVFNDRRLVVHEELLLPGLLTALAQAVQAC